METTETTETTQLTHDPYLMMRLYLETITGTLAEGRALLENVRTLVDATMNPAFEYQVSTAFTELRYAFTIAHNQARALADVYGRGCPPPLFTMRKDNSMGRCPLSNIGLSPRTEAALGRVHIYRVEDVDAYSDANLLAVRGLGPKGVLELREKIRTMSASAMAAPNPANYPTPLGAM